jgi:hypothetical protein
MATWFESLKINGGGSRDDGDGMSAVAPNGDGHVLKHDH